VHLSFREATLKNSTVKRAYWGAILGWVTSWEDFQAACERGRNTPKKLMVICGANRQSLKPLLVRLATERGRGNYRWYQSRPATVSSASGWLAHGQSPSGAKILGVDRRSRGLTSRSVGEAQRGRCVLQVRVIVTPRVWLKRIELTIYITKGAPFFRKVHA